MGSDRAYEVDRISLVMMSLLNVRCDCCVVESPAFSRPRWGFSPCARIQVYALRFPSSTRRMV
jgi:hypothetical protein